MSELSENPSLKEINAYKKKINWGDVPAIYQLASSSISDVDGILTHGFSSAYKQLFDKKNWNQQLIEPSDTFSGQANTIIKPKISLFHHMSDRHYELHCYPIMYNECVLQSQHNNPHCPFIKWVPGTMQILFRLNSLVPFIVYTFQKGDKADYALIRYANQRVEELIDLLDQSFDITDITGYSIAEFCKEIYSKRSQVQSADGADKPENMEN